jgi:hypothetical protein
MRSLPGFDKNGTIPPDMLFDFSNVEPVSRLVLAAPEWHGVGDEST